MRKFTVKLKDKTQPDCLLAEDLYEGCYWMIFRVSGKNVHLVPAGEIESVTSTEIEAERDPYCWVPIVALAAFLLLIDITVHVLNIHTP